MSADNAIAILVTLDTFLEESEGCHTRIAPHGAPGVPVFRVAHIQGPDAFEAYRAEELHNLGWWMAHTFERALVFTDAEAAEAAARQLEQDEIFVEYGVVTLDARPMNFPGC